MMTPHIEAKPTGIEAPKWKGVRELGMIREDKFFLRLVMLTCGKRNCTKCPHGPYWYFGYSHRRKVRQIYLGKTLLGERTLKHPDILAVVRAATKDRGIEPIAKDAGRQVHEHPELFTRVEDVKGGRDGDSPED